VAVERDRRLVEELRARGVRVLYGDAAAPGILTAAGAEHARLLISATPDGYQARRAFEIARGLNPGIDTVMRSHSEAEAAYLDKNKAGLVVVAERELAPAIMGYALRSLGLSEGQARLYVQSARGLDDEMLAPRGERHGGAPELRPHRDREEP
jgi:CPA2 family monovalent cation:H+ antiporter-2